MNRTDHQLDRLFRAAARAPERVVNNAPLALEARVLAGWRRAAPPTDTPLLLLPFLRFTALCAGVVLAISLVIYFSDNISTAENELAVSGAPIQLVLLP